MPAHTHDIHTVSVTIGGYGATGLYGTGWVVNNIHYANTTGYTESTGGSGAHNNLQPYITLNYIIKI